MTDCFTVRSAVVVVVQQEHPVAGVVHHLAVVRLVFHLVVVEVAI